MNIKLIKLSVQGQNKIPKEVEFNENNTLIQGSSDTGKSYILSSIYYCLNGTDIPKNVGYSNGYTTFILTFSLRSKKYTIIRDYAFNINKIYLGEFYDVNPPREFFASNKINDFMISELNLSPYKIITKSGKIGNITLSNLKYFSFFNEDRTLSSDFFISTKDKSKILERKSLFSFLLNGQDDKKLELSTAQDEKHRIDGRISVYNTELLVLNEWFDKNNIEKSLSRNDILEKISFLDIQIEQKLDVKITNQEKIRQLNSDLNNMRKNLNENLEKIQRTKENISNFKILNKKYDSDKERLTAILNTHLIFEKFSDHNCPLCDSIIKNNSNENIENLIDGIKFELNKILVLQEELNKVIPELDYELNSYINDNEIQNQQIRNNLAFQLEIKNHVNVEDILNLTNKRSLFEHAMSISEKIEHINYLIEDNVQVKNKKIKVIRELSVQFNIISIRCKALLSDWGLTNIHNLYISNDEMDLIINQRQRISYGKGKRAIFLTAFAISIMEYSLDNNLAHLGFLIIDSPLVTHKDPKYGASKLNDDNRAYELESYMNETVAQKFYKWLVEYKGKGQILVIENDAPNEKFKDQINYIEFTGNPRLGRSGFF